METNTEYLVAIDDGYAQTKLYGDSPSGGVIKRSMRSSARSGRFGGLTSLSGGRGGIGSYETEEGDVFTVSDEIEAESTKFDGFHTSTMNRALVTHSLISAGFGNRKVFLVTGLPVADYFLDDGKNLEHIKTKEANLKKRIWSPNNDVLMPIISDVKVGCQAVAAFIDYVVDDNGEERNDPTGRIAVVDIGGRTTDIAVVVGGSNIDHSMSGTENIGVLDVYDTLGREIRAHFKIRDKFPLSALDQAVRTGKIQIWGKDNEIGHLVAPILKEHEKVLAREVERRLGSAASLSAVVFVGGGSALFTGIASHFPNGMMAEDPEFANARGLFKFVKYLGG
jgi:plasmid segregation protein ParM